MKSCKHTDREGKNSDERETSNAVRCGVVSVKYLCFLISFIFLLKQE